MKALEFISRLEEYAQGSPIFADPPGKKTFEIGNIGHDDKEYVSKFAQARGRLSDGSRIDALYEHFKSKGYTIKEVSQEEIYKLAGTENDPIAFRSGNDIYISLDYHGKPLTEDERMSALFHEVGHEKTDSEIGAQRKGISVAESLGYPGVTEIMERQLSNLQKADFN